MAKCPACQKEIPFIDSLSIAKPVLSTGRDKKLRCSQYKCSFCHHVFYIYISVKGQLLFVVIRIVFSLSFLSIFLFYLSFLVGRWTSFVTICSPFAVYYIWWRYFAKPAVGV